VKAVLALLLAASCVSSHHVVVDGGELRRNADTLRMRGHATVNAVDQIDEGEDSQEQRTKHVDVRLDQTLVVEGAPRVVRDLIQNCEEDGAGSGAICPLTELQSYPIDVRRYESREIGRAVGRGLVLGVAGVLIASVACGLECRDGSGAKEASYVGLGVVAVGVVGLLAWILIDCYGRSGSSGCHD
jgi:hypothetical protein